VSCRTSCTVDTDCVQDFICAKSDCVALTGPVCDGVDTLRQPVAAGGYQKCAASYACPAGATACLKKCDSVTDCVDGFVCQQDDAGQGSCLAPAEVTTPATPFCAVGSAPGGDRGGDAWQVAALGLLALVAARRRR
jgi:MYXO-CTERM domain-containing protein